MDPERKAELSSVYTLKLRGYSVLVPKYPSFGIRTTPAEYHELRETRSALPRDGILSR